MSTTTLVTCFFDTSSSRIDNTGDKSKYWDSNLAYVTCPLVVYGNSDYVDYIRDLRPKHLNTEYNVKNVEELEFYDIYDRIENNRKISWPTSDSRSPTIVHIIQGNKIVFLTDVANRNPFNTTHFAFMDCNLMNKMHVTNEILQDRLSHMKNKFHAMLLGVTDYKAPYNVIYQTYKYVLVGGFIAGDKEHCSIIERLFKEEFRRTVEAGYGHGEEMIYTKILYNNWDLFEISYGDYQECVRNIHDITQNEEYILNHCAIPYASLLMYEQLLHCTNKLISSPNITPVVLFKSMYYNYIANYWLNKVDSVRNIVNNMGDLISKCTDIRKHFYDNYGFYTSNISYASRWEVYLILD
jgi:hypothetical protein